VWRSLFSRRWAGALALAAVFAVVAVMLGNWQYSKHEDRLVNRDRVEQHYDAAPVPLREVLPEDGTVPGSAEWTRVSVSGSYLPGEQLMVRNRPHNGRFGYEVLVPFRPADGSTAILVDRGWLPNAADASTLPEVPPPPSGPTELTGWLRPDEPSLDRDLPVGQLASINVPEAADQLGDMPLHDGYLVLEAESPGVERPVPLAEPRTGLGPHFAYALQWWLTAPVGFVLVYVFARRDYRDSTEETAQTDQQRPHAAAGRARKVRIWDEEDG
jgi:cytochrome oxidase assembly protein ShyY1